jgi:cell division protein WhiA
LTFAQKVKSELCAAECKNGSVDGSRCCEKAELYGLLLYCRRFSQTGVTVQTEHLDVAQKAAELLEKLYHIEPVQKNVVRGDGRSAVCVSIEREADLNRLFTAFGHDGKNVTLRINRANIENECCGAAFLRGVFLACGSIVDPGKDYHLEFVSPHIRLGRDLADFIGELGPEPKTIVRKGNFVVYFKDSEKIEDVLTFMGAVQRSLELMNIKVYKDLRNKVNRVTNCETANIGKTVNAAGQQLEAINKLIAAKGYEFLPEELREVAKIRLDNPDASLRELAQIAGISRSGVNHRLSRIMEMVNTNHR